MDGMPEYWWAARGAALQLDPSLSLAEHAPAAFALLRPLIHKGWEMVLLAAELADPEFLVPADGSAYAACLAAALERRGWQPSALQERLESVRRQALERDPEQWLALHRFYPGVEQRLRRLDGEGAAWLVLTTKGGAFAARLLEAAGLVPRMVYGHEQGSKPEVLLTLCQPGREIWFIEDRRPTLETVRLTPGLETVRCFLALWGYLAPGDTEGLERLGIRALSGERFAADLAQWP